MTPTLQDILEAVSRHAGVPVETLQSRRRSRYIADGRKMYCWLARQCTRHSLQEVADELGRHHTAVIHMERDWRVIMAEYADLELSSRTMLEALGGTTKDKARAG